MTDHDDNTPEQSAEEDEHTKPTVRIDDDELADIVSEQKKAKPKGRGRGKRPSLASDDSEDETEGPVIELPPVRKADVDESADGPVIELPPIRKADVDESEDGPVIALPPSNKADADAQPSRAKRADDDDDDDDDPFGADIDALDDDSSDDSSDDGATGNSEDEAPKDPPEIDESLIDKDALWVVRRLRAKGYEAYLTGGCVRDVLLGREPKDFDVATAATPNQVRSVFRNCRLVGRRFRLAHVYFPGNKVIETATFRANPLDSHEEDELPEDLLLERDNVFGNIEEDARRRDLTINGLFYDPLAGKVIDFVQGREDIDARLIRTIGDPQIRFQEDPVRIIRAIKFATRLEFGIEKETLQAMKDQVGELARCSPPRLQEEIVRLLTSGHAARAMEMCADVGVFQVLMAELNQGLSVELAPAPVEQPAEPAAEQAADQAPAAEAGADDGDTKKADAQSDGDGNAPVTAASDDDNAPAGGEDATADANAEAVQAPTEGAPAGGESSDDEQRAKTKIVPVPSTPPPPPAAPEDRNARLATLLKTLDEVKERGAEITSAVAFATLLLPVWEAYLLSDQDEEKWLEDLTTAWGERLRLTRRDKDSLSILYGGLEQLSPPNRHGSKARHLVGRPWFREALLLYVISKHASGESLDDVAKWKAIANHYQKPYAALRPGEREPRPRRTRRSRGGSGGGGGRGRGRGRGR